MQQAAREAGNFSFLDVDRGRLVGRMILCRDRLVGRLWRERRGRSGLPPQAVIRRKKREFG